ncbi:MAG: hypothetical protein WDM76_03040 [Limisphaerales bacterium]
MQPGLSGGLDTNAFASFGIITPVLSVVLSVFMLGLAVGSWLGGRWISSLAKKTGLSAVLFYAGAELLIGLGAFVVPKLFAFGEYVLLSSGETDFLPLSYSFSIGSRPRQSYRGVYAWAQLFL